MTDARNETIRSMQALRRLRELDLARSKALYLSAHQEFDVLQRRMRNCLQGCERVDADATLSEPERRRALAQRVAAKLTLESALQRLQTRLQVRLEEWVRDENRLQATDRLVARRRRDVVARESRLRERDYEDAVISRVSRGRERFDPVPGGTNG